MAIFHSYVKLPEGILEIRAFRFFFFAIHTRTRTVLAKPVSSLLLYVHHECVIVSKQIPKQIQHHLVGGFNDLEKDELVNGVGIITYKTWKIIHSCSKPPTSFPYMFIHVP